MNAWKIRQVFEEYYATQGYQHLERASMLHPSIPMAFVMSAGLVQIETALTRLPTRSGDKFVLVQDCFRQFDLDKVGADDYHLSFFQMPGAFVFGPNGKGKTVEQMWTLATRILGVPNERIWVSYFKGGDILGERVPSDLETRQAWIALGVSPDHIVGLGRDNYWVQGGGIDGVQAIRKCGPNTELFYDRGIDRACSSVCQPGCACGRFVEFSNSLFIHRELDLERQTFQPMAEPFTETVIGVERVAMILQGASSVFEIEGYRGLLECIRRFANPIDERTFLVIASERVLADHLRALYGLIANGAPPPGKDGRQRIVKLLIRGAITRALILGIAIETTLPALIDCVADFTDGADLDRSLVSQRLRTYFATEHQRFERTIERGQQRLERYLNANPGQSLSGEQTIALEKNWGMPHLLTVRVLQARGLDAPVQLYAQALNEWKRLPHH